MSWSNTSHITPADEAEHQISIAHKRLQKRIHELRRKRSEPKVDFEVETIHIGKDEDIVDVLHAIMDEVVENMEKGPDENDKS